MLAELSWLLTAFVAGWVAVRLRMPAMVGYIIAGGVLGLAGSEPTALLEGVGHTGVLFLLFGVGLHLRLRNLFDRVVLAGSAIHLLISTALFVLVTVPLGLDLPVAAFLGVILSFSSTVLAAKGLENREELGAYYGRLTIGILLVQDLVAIAVILAAMGRMPEPGALMLPLLLLFRPLLNTIISQARDTGLLLLFTGTSVLMVAELFDAAHVPGECGALLLGALLADHRRANEIQKSLWSLKEFFLVGFFLQIGMLAMPDPGVLHETLGWVVICLLLLPFKGALFFLLLTALGLRARTAFLTGTTLTSYSEFTLLAGLIGVQQDLISAQIFSVVTLVTALSFVVNLPANQMVGSIFKRFEPWLLRFRPRSTHRDRPLASLGRASHVVVGMGRTGSATYEHLRQQGYKPIGIDADPVIIERQIAAGRRVVFGDALDPEQWEILHIEHLQGAVVSVPNLTARLRTTAGLKSRKPELKIATYALHEVELEPLREAGAVEVHHILADAGVYLAKSILPKASQ